MNRVIEFPLIGMIKKITNMKNAIVLKLIDLDNLIDSYTIFINFTNDENLEEITPKLKIGNIVSFKNNIKTSISKNFEIWYALNYDKTSEINIANC